MENWEIKNTELTREILPKLVAFLTSGPYSQVAHKRSCVVLGKLVRLRPDLTSYASRYFKSKPSPFVDDDQMSSKRIKENSPLVGDLELVEACFYLLKHVPNLSRRWNWSEVVAKYLNHEDSKVRWMACHCIARAIGIIEKQLEQLVRNVHIAPELEQTYSLRFDSTNSLTEEKHGLDHYIPKAPMVHGHTEEVVDISGIYVPRVTSSPAQKKDSEELDLVLVESTCNNLRKVALGLDSRKAVCLQGPVGCGKTSLVEYLANKTGRKLGETFIKVQLGDQTDSKMLLGTYRCTDIPGEFVWQPGVVTQAVIEGHWLLLEDIDSASMDIASVLSSLLENGTLTVPGYRDAIPVGPDFQLFFSQRFVSTITGHHKIHSSTMTLLQKHLLQVTVDPLLPEELITILKTRHPQFSNIANRMLAVFQIFSNKSTDPDVGYIAKSGRLISTRDFFKWAARAARDYHSSLQADGVLQTEDFQMKLLQNAIDVFCCSIPNGKEALTLAREISTQLNIINQKADHYFKQYKPTRRLNIEHLIVGRAKIPRDHSTVIMKSEKFFFTRPSALLLERVMVCVASSEPILLVGETGTGKTSSVQYLAHTIGKKLVVINMNQQSDSADLLGGYKPVDLKFVIAPIKREFEHVFCDFFNTESNEKFLGHIATCYNLERWADLTKLMMQPYKAAISRLKGEDARKMNETGKRQLQEDVEIGKNNLKMLSRWEKLGEKLHKLSLQLKQKSALAFAFIEGSLVKAVENGHWVLLDEINLANMETLECLSGLLEGSKGSLCLLERGDKRPVQRHKDFTLFACMNPSTDVGKKDLPAGLRNRFTEYFVDELATKEDLMLLVGSYLVAMSPTEKDLEGIVGFYLRVRKEADTVLTDGLGHKPHFSLRSLCRALMIAAKNPCGNSKRSLYEAFCLSFLTQLDAASYMAVEKLIAMKLIGNSNTLKSILHQPIPHPNVASQDTYVQFEGYWVRKGNLDCVVPDDYVLTASVRRNLKDLVRVVSIGGLPVLLQGDTSVGKTSLITYLAKSSGNKCVRINNHEHTDLQEYIGSYVADINGKLVFREGLLVEAMRQGHWIILDELNLAPTDVLEALNRVLDDNRELFIPETQKTVKADPNFMLFATQNPPGSYGGRKMLSRAFRNRFVELHFNEIPPAELEVILHRRCKVPPSYAKKMINVMTDLQQRRRGSAAFAGKQGFMTLRDLFRWGQRYSLANNISGLYDWDQHLADEGFLVLGGRVRKTEEKNEIVTVLQKHWKRKVNPENLFTLCEETSMVTKEILTRIHESQDKFKNIVWTYNLRQLAVLVAKAFQFKEPVLLVGETGGGKTTVCQLIAEQNGQQLISVNCHMHSESSDFIGGLRPVRDHAGDDMNRLFEWVDGPLIQAMVRGDVFLADEISLADDSVLERLNSLLEPERTLLLAEKGSDINNSSTSELIVAASGFHFISTMNPGGDFGKKELSPALRNRFTEIWCESCTERRDLVAIIERNVKTGLSFGNQQDGSSGVGNKIMDFVEWFKETEVGKRITTSIRDILTWVEFINTCSEKQDLCCAYLHGACLTFIDGLGSGITGTESSKYLESFRTECLAFLTAQTAPVNPSIGEVTTVGALKSTDDHFGIDPFLIEVGENERTSEEFAFDAPTTRFNTLRLLRGMQLNKAILLEGSPGVGKTSLVTALAKCTGHTIFRVNLSDQTDISDLFGADLPVEGGVGGQFSWRDGPLLQALKQGNWILLDELNLASQSVLEGLNACLDHRGEIFIPELGKTFHVKPGTRFFACQNPLKQGGQRRGLPQSFLNRFIQVYVSPLTPRDLEIILTLKYTTLPVDILRCMLKFNTRMVEELDGHSFGHKGSPWELNLRDLSRWCEAVIFQLKSGSKVDPTPESLVQLIYADRMRTLKDKERVREIFLEVFGCEVSGDAPVFDVDNDKVYFGDINLNRCVDDYVSNHDVNGLVLRTQIPVLRSLAYCVSLNWMSLLVGSSASGKNSVVKVLASLCRRTLRTLPVTSAMDTTDILGGFEQTDYARHLEEVAKETEGILRRAVQSCLLRKSNSEEAANLLGFWENYIHLEDNTESTHTMEQEVKLFLKKLDKLEIIWEAILRVEGFSEEENVERLKNKVKAMSENVKKEGSLNAGGKFEWVDSIFIKCLQDGSWLLVDNVNLCSAAVLDRLNALLEPNGVLTIGERGVDATGKMVEIKPHPNFRLFLTMDPKNGEISRAMRNRGVEIYMLTEDEAEHRNVADLRSLIYLQGLTQVSHINLLLGLHDHVCTTILCEKPNINELLRAASLVSQQLKHGIPALASFRNAIVEVYYKTRSKTEFGCADFVSDVDEFITQFIGGAEGPGVGFHAEMTLSTESVAFKACLARIKQQAVVLKAATSQDVAKLLLVHFYSMSSVEDLELRNAYFVASVTNEAVRKSIGKTLYDILSKNLTSGYASRLPFDANWAPEVRCEFSENNRNGVLVALHFVAEQQTEVLLNSKTSLLNYMRNEDITLITDFSKLLKLYDHFLLEVLFKQNLSFDSTNAIKILHLLTWRFLLQRASSVDVKGTTALQRYVIVSSLKVHFRWFFKNSLKAISDILVSPVKGELKKIAETINETIEKQYSKLHKLGNAYQKAALKPLPKTSDAQIEAARTLQRLCTNFRDTPKICTKKLRAAILAATDEEILIVPDDNGLFENLTEHEAALLPVIDYYTQRTVHKSIRSLLAGTQECPQVCFYGKTVSLELATSLSAFAGASDQRVWHGAFKAAIHYLLTSHSTPEGAFPGLNPALTHHVTNLAIGDQKPGTEQAVTCYGNFREVALQHRILSLNIWRNFKQLSSHDFTINERNFLHSNFTLFQKQLREAVSRATDFANATLGDVVDPAHQFLIRYIENCTDLDKSWESMSLSQIAAFHLNLSYVKAILNSRLPLIDPSAKKSLKKKYIEESVRNFENLRDSFVVLNSVFSDSEKSLHKHHSAVVALIGELKDKSSVVNDYVAVRPCDLLYEEVAKTVSHGFFTILSPKSVCKLVGSICNVFQESEKLTDELLVHLEGTSSSIETLLLEWGRYTCTYPDVVEPLLANVAQFLYGLKMSIALFKRIMWKSGNGDFDVQGEVTNLVRMPGINFKNEDNEYGLMIDRYTDSRLHDLVGRCFDEEAGSEKKRTLLRLFKSGIQESFNNCVLESKPSETLTRPTFVHFERLLKSFIGAWRLQEKEREEREQEADSLYKTKTKCDSKPEEVQIAEEMRLLFPNYHESDFSDLQQKDLDSEDSEVVAEDDFQGVISADDVRFVMDLHKALLKNFTRCEWLNPEKNRAVAPDFVGPLVEKYRVFKKVFDKTLTCLDYEMDKELVTSLHILVSYVRNYGDRNTLVEQSSPSRAQPAKRTDVYKDPNVEEVKSSFHIIEQLRLRVLSLLEEWPEESTLRTILTIIDRICKFEITSPLSRFLTGFEILLSKCNEWEEKAHSGVSLCEHSQNITHQIIAWRKMELNVWKDLLDITFERANEISYKWWLHLYTTTEEYVTQEKLTDVELVETFQKFMSSSNLGEFQSRLDLLYTFHCHALFMDRTKATTNYISILWNVYCYFKQFVPNVVNKIKDLRNPIEKKLKDYVKIVRWKDINYWAIKETVDKSHKTLHKYVREFQDVLRQPVTSCLVNTTSSGGEENVGIWDRPQRSSVKTYHYTLDPSTYIVKESPKKTCTSDGTVAEQTLLEMDSDFIEARKLCKEAISATRYPTLIKSLDGFVTEVIETSSHFQKLEVDTTLPKSKQKSQAKSIQQQKRRALADLFKSLSNMGLSSQTGLMEAGLKEIAQDFLLRPIDISASFSHINYNRKDEKILTIWDSCEMYYLKSLMRADVLETAMKVPAKDLGPQDITRCRGFTSHLLFLAQKQKSSLIESSRLFYYLRYYTTRMTELCEGKSFASSQAIDVAQILMKNITIFMEQLKIVLFSCPEEELAETAGDMADVVVLQPEPIGFIQFKYDIPWSNAMGVIKDIMGVVAKLSHNFEKMKGQVPCADRELSRLQYAAVSDVSSLENDMDNILKKIETLIGIFEGVSFAQSLSNLCAELQNLKASFHKTASVQSDDNVEECVKTLTKKIDLVVKNISKKYNRDSVAPAASVEVDEATPIEEGHLRQRIVEDLVNDFALLDLQNIFDSTDELASLLFKLNPLEFPKIISLTSCVLPILEQAILLYQYFLTQQVSAYRVICKMSSVLLNIFIELASKGFCIPPELTDEESGEGEGKPTDGLGLGEGKGERDVSDKIESEDQLDDAQPAGQEREKKDEEDDCKEEDKGIEMSEDFEGKMQDVDPKEDDDDESPPSPDEEQMGETETGADKQDKETWGSDEEEEKETGQNPDQTDDKEEIGEGGEKLDEQELAASESNNKQGENQDTNEPGKNEKEETKKEINEMEEPEIDEEQMDPYHRHQQELPEPEPLDLPDDFQLEDGEDANEEQGEENPFDIDTMKEQNPFDPNGEDEGAEEKEEDKKDDKPDYSSEDEEITKVEDDPADDEGTNEPGKEENESKEKAEKSKKEDEANDEDDEPVEAPGLDESQTNQDRIEAMDVDNTSATDKTQNNELENRKSNQPIEELCQEDSPDKEGVGQSQMEESESGHSAQTTVTQEVKSTKRKQGDDEEEEDKKQKPGESDAQRSLGDVDAPAKKKFKSVEISKDEDASGGEENEEHDQSEMFQHIKEAKDNVKTQILDVANKEQAEQQKLEKDEKEDETMETDEAVSVPESEANDPLDETAKQNPETIDKNKSKNKKEKKQHPDGEVLEDLQNIEVEGEYIKTMWVSRGTQSTIHTMFDNLTSTSAPRLTTEEINLLRSEVMQQVSSWNEVPSDAEADRAWQKIASVTSSMAQNLSEQLRLVLEPTRTSHLKGDYRTGRRINMRKVIPYIASQFRKDKIWLRRTKPAKRDYQIVLGIDDSSSMGNTNVKELAFESVALISRALSLLESGQLSILSFGENVEVLHKLTDQFTERSGVKLLQKLNFDQKDTCVSKLVNFATEMFAQSPSGSASTAQNAKLLIIVGDGFNIFGEGELLVRNAVRRARLEGVFMVYLIIENPDSEMSILDTQSVIMKPGKPMEIVDYMGIFPFPFYIILRDINAMPSILSDALRQWFEVMSNIDKP